MTDNTALQRVMRLRHLGRQIAASLPADLDREQAFQVRGYVRDLPAGAPRRTTTTLPTSTTAGARSR
jgi:hypothetical protein